MSIYDLLFMGLGVLENEMRPGRVDEFAFGYD
jgi:hypothetical protein